MGERNALAELSEFLKENSEMPSKNFERRMIERFGKEGYERFIARKRKYAKAARIIAELAKVSDAIGYADEFAKDGYKECIYIPATQQLCVRKILNCRAIAEEGDWNER